MVQLGMAILLTTPLSSSRVLSVTPKDMSDGYSSLRTSAAEPAADGIVPHAVGMVLEKLSACAPCFSFGRWLMSCLGWPSPDQFEVLDTLTPYEVVTPSMHHGCKGWGHL